MKKGMIILAAAFTIISCGPVPFANVTGGIATVFLKADSSASNISPSENNFYRVDGSIKKTTDLTSWYDAYYSDFGVLYESLTPESFSITVGEIDIINRTVTDCIAVDPFSIDFFDSSKKSRTIETSKLNFETLYIVLKDGEWLNDMSLVIETTAPSFDPADPNEVNDLGSGRYEITALEEIQPDLEESPTSHSSLKTWNDDDSIKHIVFTTNVNEPMLWIADSWDDKPDFPSITGNEMYDSSYSSIPQLLILPWEGMDIPAQAESVELSLVLNTKDLIEIYNIGGGQYRAIMANKYWERFSLDIDYNY